ncbi:hypothetical protein JQS43_01395 [Natronosporangium hydrolyticum]|uniref:Uncharacterized protein n=1 Tax=Natronosporangium hydrolyticum TaxID=2811111 RepID=A0A895YB93_9ACTN|nr:hypothetical protein [Natronosporangium hydrolyticum]QSB15064.1 hypothetical protein JQS43_01395 [Natronosporangium hydrolyticum]
MATHQGGNGGEMPPEGDRPRDPDLPELPTGWGEVPDDASELSAEAEQLRAELAEERLTGRRRPPAEPADDPSGDDPEPRQPSISTPLLIMSVAVVITLISLFAMAWSGASTLPDDRNGVGTPAVDSAALPPLTLPDATGRQVILQAQTPMVLMLVEECDCQQLVSATAAAAPAGVRVVLVGHSAPPVPTGLAPGDPQPLRLADPSGAARAELSLPPPSDAATVILVDASGQIRDTVPAATSVAQYQAELTNLGS